jgi:hypothetical protein
VAVATVLIGVNILTAQDAPPPLGAVQGAGPYGQGGKGAAPAPEDHDGKIQELLSQYTANENEDDRKKVAESLDKVIGEQFDERQHARAAELKELEDQLAKLRKLHDKRSSQKDTIVRERTRQLLRDADGLGWNYDSPSRGRGGMMGMGAGAMGPAMMRGGSYPAYYGGSTGGGRGSSAGRQTR